MKKFLFIILVIIAILIPVVNALAIDIPTSGQIYSVNAYKDLLEVGDQLYIVYYNVSYNGTYPIEPANESLICKMKKPDTSILTYSELFGNLYFHSGYGAGIVSFYFTASDVVTYAITWNDTYTFSIEGNPALSWNGTFPSIISNVTWSGTGLKNRLLYIFAQLQSKWGVNLIDSGTLSDYGESYGVSTIPYLRYFVPTLFSSYSEKPYYPERTKSWTYALTLGNQWIGTWLDLATLSGIVHIPEVWLYAGIWLVVMSAIIFAVIEAPKFMTNSGIMSISAPKNPKMIMYLVVILVFFGGITGFLPWVSLILVGFVLILMIVNQLAFNKATG